MTKQALRAIVYAWAAACLLLSFVARARAVTVKLDESDGPEVTLALHPGDRLHLELPAQPSTGYSWWAGTRTPEFLFKLGGAVRESGGLMGGPAVQSFTWQVLRPGEGALELIYDRRFAPAPKPAKTYTLRFVVGGDDTGATAALGAASVLTPLASYAGRAPCADCIEMHERILLYAKGPHDFTGTAYVLKRTYEGTGRTYVETGAWSLLRGTRGDANATVYQLRQNPAAPPQDFAVKADTLIPLDAENVPLSGPPAMDLALHKEP